MSTQSEIDTDDFAYEKQDSNFKTKFCDNDDSEDGKNSTDSELKGIALIENANNGFTKCSDCNITFFNPSGVLKCKFCLVKEKRKHTDDAEQEVQQEGTKLENIINVLIKVQFSIVDSPNLDDKSRSEENQTPQQQKNVSLKKTIISPLTNISSSDVSANSANSKTSCLLSDDDVFLEGTTHSKSMSIPSRLCSNYSQITFYCSNSVFSTEIEEAIQIKNETNTSKFYAGVDVVYQTARKTFTCVPLYCPARIYGGATNEDPEVYVGIIYDGNGAYPIMAVYDIHGTFKNLTKCRNVVHNNFKRISPTHIAHDFSEAEMKLFEESLKVFLKIRSRSDILQGVFLFNILDL